MNVCSERIAQGMIIKKTNKKRNNGQIHIITETRRIPQTKEGRAVARVKKQTIATRM